MQDGSGSARMPGQEERVDQITTPIDADGRKRSSWGWNRWTGWSGVGMLLVAVVLPFGWILPVAQLARVRASAGRRRP